MGARRKYTCEGCKALCCSDLEEAISRPRSKTDVDNLKWELHFSHTRVFIRNRRWYRLSMGRCMYLAEDNLCSIYERRPQVCRDHNPPSCEYYGAIYDTLFKTPEDLQKFIDREKKARKSRRSA